MKLIARRLRGMQDVIPGESEKWEYIEKIMKEQAKLYGFRIIRTPAVELTDLFKRATGETSDIVEKEMYTFNDKGGRDVSLRPEGTAGVVRAVLETGMHNQVLPLKLMYISSCYRYEKPQSGRYREFYQFGLEIIGGNATMADAEIIDLGNSIFERLGLKNIRLEINAICCEGCRDRYFALVRKFFDLNKHLLCDTCQSRVERNPVRIFDCKNESCKKVIRFAPLSLRYLCRDCADHLQFLKNYIDECGIELTVNPHLFRGLDYYSRTVFEFIDDSAAEPLAICGGGRYNNLSKEIGGVKINSVGLGIGMERLLEVMKRQGAKFPENKPCEIYIAPLGGPARRQSVKISHELRKVGIRAELDLVGRFIKPQMKYANKIKALYTVVIGAKEMEDKKALLKNMASGRTAEIDIDDNFVENFLRLREELDKPEIGQEESQAEQN